MMDMARRDGIRIDVAKLREELGCVVVPVSARNGEGVDELKQELNRLVTGAMPEAVDHVDPHCAGCTGCTFQARYEWTEQISTRVMDAAHRPALGVDGQAGRLFHASGHRRGGVSRRDAGAVRADFLGGANSDGAD